MTGTCKADLATLVAFPLPSVLVSALLTTMPSPFSLLVIFYALQLPIPSKTADSWCVLVIFHSFRISYVTGTILLCDLEGELHRKFVC